VTTRDLAPLASPFEKSFEMLAIFQFWMLRHASSPAIRPCHFDQRVTLLFMTSMLSKQQPRRRQTRRADPFGMVNALAADERASTSPTRLSPHGQVSEARTASGGPSTLPRIRTGRLV
jgi:hypothetical protein